MYGEKSIAEDKQPHERINDSVQYLRESSLAGLIKLRQDISNEAEAKSSEEAAKDISRSLDQVLHETPDRIYEINEELYNEIEKIRNILFS